MVITFSYAKMENQIEVKFMLSRNLTNQVLVLQSTRFPGKVYKFCKKSDNRYSCLSCKKFGKTKSITVVDGRVVGRSNPDEDHHEECIPVSEAEVLAEDIDRKMRKDIRNTGL